MRPFWTAVKWPTCFLWSSFHLSSCPLSFCSISPLAISLPLSLASFAFALMLMPHTISVSTVTADRCLLPLLQRRSPGQEVESTHANVSTSMTLRQLCQAVCDSFSLLYAKHMVNFHRYTLRHIHLGCPHQERDSVLLFPVSQDRSHHRWQTDIISSPETHPAAATFITAELIHTSHQTVRGHWPLHYTDAHTLTHISNSNIFNAFSRTHTYIPIIAHTVSTHCRHINTYLISKELSLWPSVAHRPE